MNSRLSLAKGIGLVAVVLCCLTAIVAMSCSQPEATSTPVPTRTVALTPIPEPTAAPAQTPTTPPIPVPSPTLYPTVTPVPTSPPVPTPAPTPTPGPLVDPNKDRASLIALYVATGGPHWINNNNWLTDSPISEWFGVSSDRSGRVSGLDLSDNHLRGNIPPEIGDLFYLTELFLRDNQLSGEIPPELGRLPFLGILSLERNLLSGEIPPELSGLSYLTELFLHGNFLSGRIPSEAGDLSYLRGLHLHRNMLSGGIPPELGNLSNLTDLFLYDNNLSGGIPPELGNLSYLTVLGLERNLLSGEIPPELGNLSNLTDLFLHSNYLSGKIPPELGNLTHLSGLYLHDNLLTGEIPAELGNLTRLIELFLADNELRGELPPELGGLSNLITVRFGGSNRFVGCIPNGLHNVAGISAQLRLPLCEPDVQPTPIPIPIGTIPLPGEWDGTQGIASTESAADLTPLNENGLGGSIHLIQVGRQTKVTITLNNAGPGPYAAAIRRGGCPNEGDPPSGQFDYLLFDVVDGESVSMVNTPAQFFQFSLAYVIVVDGRDLQTDPSISCGNIPSPLR